MAFDTPAPSSLFAGEVQYWRVAPDAWRPILEQACAAGLPGVSTYVPWEIHEIAPGEFDFTGKTDPKRDLVRYLELVKELGLRLAFRPGPFVCNEMDWGGHPRRIVMGDVGMMVLNAQGRPAQGYHVAQKEGHQPSYLHPAYLEEVRTWLGAVDAVAKDYAAGNGGPITTCNLDNELSYIVQDSMFGADYNPCVIGPGGLYARWLEDKYGSPDNLPYTQGWKRFDDATPPRALGTDLEANLRWYFDWIECKEWILAEYLKRLRAMHEEFGLTGVHFYTNLNPHRPEGVPTNFVRYAEATGGLVGYDFYRSPWLKYSGYVSMARVLKVMESNLPVIWSAEFMSGWWMTDMGGSRVPANHMEFMGKAAMANGCQALSWFMFHDRDNWGDCPVSELGHPRDSHIAVKDMMAATKALPEWDELKPVCDCAVLYARTSMWHCHLGDPNPCADGELHVGEPGLWGSTAGAASAEFEGLFRMIQQAGYTPGCVDLTDAPHRLQDYKVIFWGGASFLDPLEAQALADYVQSGGTLLVDLAWPRFTLDGAPLRFLGLDAPPATGEAAGPFTLAAVGQGTVGWTPRVLATSEAGEEDLDVIGEFRATLQQLIGAPVADVEMPVMRWRTWVNGAGWKEEPHGLVDAILHAAGETRVLYVVNIHERSARTTIHLQDIASGSLEEVGGLGQTIAIDGNKAAVDVDRKSVRIFRVHPSA